MDADEQFHVVAEHLAELYRRNGYVRRQNAERLARDGAQHYKKGDEVRLTARSLGELATIRRLLRQAGFKPGRPFRHAHQLRQPIYGRQEVERFLTLVSAEAGTRRPGR